MTPSVAAPGKKGAPSPPGAGDTPFCEIVAHMREAVVLLDEEGTVRYANEAATALLGTAQAPLAGSRFPLAVPLRELQEVRLPGPEERSAELWAVSILAEGEALTVVYCRDVTDRVREREEWQALCLLDEVTGLYNRRGFTMLARQQMKMAHRLHGELYLLFADVDGLKLINDVLGHQEGDRALADVASLLKSTFRESDVVARLAGDEFAVLAPVMSGEHAQVLVQRLQESLTQFNQEGSRPYQLSLSVGVTGYSPEHPCSLEELLHRADTLMYVQKREKRGGPTRLRPGVRPASTPQLLRRGRPPVKAERNARRGLL